MTAAMVSMNSRTQAARPRPSLEELVDRLMAELFAVNTVNEVTGEPSAPRSIHEARRLRQTGDMDGALAALARMDVKRAETRHAQWAFTEWRQLVRRQFADRDAALYTQGTGRAAALAPHGDGTLEVVAALGMGWKPGKLVSRRSLRGLRPLMGGA